MEAHVIRISVDLFLYIWTIGIIRSQTKQMNGRLNVYWCLCNAYSDCRTVLLSFWSGFAAYLDMISLTDTITTCSPL